jgi:hypothetical protein
MSAVPIELSDELVIAAVARARELGLIEEPRRFLSKDALAEHLGVEPRTIKSWRAQGMPAHVGRPLMFDLEEVNRWLAQRPA